MEPGFPVLLNLKGRLCVVVGGGEVAMRKVRTLAERGGRVRVVSPDVVPGIRQMAEEGVIEWVERPYRDGDLQGALLAVATVDNREVNADVAGEAKQRGVLANIADDPGRSDYQVPSFFEDGPLLIALSTSGSSPAVARTLRRMIQSYLGNSFGAALDIIAQFRENVVKLEIASPKDRGRFWETALTPELLETVRQGNLPDLEPALRQALDRFKAELK